MSRIYIPTTGPDDWKSLLADPTKHWRTGYSARSLACSWEGSTGFPLEIQAIFGNSSCTRFKDIELLLAIPEHKVPLPGGTTQSQNDIFVLAKADGELVSITIEGKVSEAFGPTIGDWSKDLSKGKVARLDYLKEQLGLSGYTPPDVRYHLLHRTASAVIEAKRFNAKSAVMVVHSFSPDNERFEDFTRFLELFKVSARLGELVHANTIGGVDLYLGWAKGDAKFLSV